MTALTNIRLQHFRSYDDESFEFSPHVNIIVGPNASGKTNLLEAILMLARGASYRARDADLVAFGRPWARLDADVQGDQRTVKLVNDPQPGKTYEIAGRMFKRLTLEHALPVVLFEPDHLRLLTGSPERRRDYLDDLLTRAMVGYGATVRAYKRALAQRNALLKSGRASAEQLFPWNVRLSELAGQIVRARVQIAGELDRHLGTLYQEVSRSPVTVRLAYQHATEPLEYESRMLHELESRLSADLARGFTSFGPHREDFLVYFNGRPAAEVASRGETRTALLALKIIELQLLDDRMGNTPLLLLDDVFSELDGKRREALTQHLRDYQTFITTTDADVVVQHFAERSTIIPIARS